MGRHLSHVFTICDVIKASFRALLLLHELWKYSESDCHRPLSAPCSQSDFSSHVGFDPHQCVWITLPSLQRLNFCFLYFLASSYLPLVSHIWVLPLILLHQNRDSDRDSTMMPGNLSATLINTLWLQKVDVLYPHCCLQPFMSPTRLMFIKCMFRNYKSLKGWRPFLNGEFP